MPPRSAAARVPPVPTAGHCWPMPLQETHKHTKAGLAQSLRGLWVLVAPGFVWALWASLEGMGFDSKCNFAPPTILLELLLCPWMWSIFFLVGFNILLSMVVQWVAILEFSQEKTSTHPSTPPSGDWIYTKKILMVQTTTMVWSFT